MSKGAVRSCVQAVARATEPEAKRSTVKMRGPWFLHMDGSTIMINGRQGMPGSPWAGRAARSGLSQSRSQAGAAEP